MLVKGNFPLPLYSPPPSFHSRFFKMVLHLVWNLAFAGFFLLGVWCYFWAGLK